MNADGNSSGNAKELCSHDWQMEPAWRLVSRGLCQKCKTVKVFQNNPGVEGPVRRRLRRRKQPTKSDTWKCLGKTCNPIDADAVVVPGTNLDGVC